MKVSLNNCECGCNGDKKKHKQIYSLDWYRKNPDKVKINREKEKIRRRGKPQNYYKTPKSKYNVLIQTSKRREIEVSLTFEDWSNIVLNNSCEYCGGKLPSRGYGLDRKNSQLGYTKDNVVPCCASCNTIRGEDLISYEEMKFIMPLLLEHRRNKVEQGLAENSKQLDEMMEMPC